MLLTSIILMVLGYTMVYSTLHGNWQFWSYFFPKTSAPAALAGTAATSSAAA
jgi:hypothetical protein